MDTNGQLNLLIKVFSEKRMARYVTLAETINIDAVQLYEYNLALSEAFYTPLQTLELILRNAINIQCIKLEGECWYDSTRLILNDTQKTKIKKAKLDLDNERKLLTHDNLTAALNFAFWTGMLGKDYENLWQQHLYKIALSYDGKGRRRKALSTPLQSIRVLRNRIAHHEPIIGWDIEKQHNNIMRMIGLLNSDALEWCKKVSRFDEVYNASYHQTKEKT